MLAQQEVRDQESRQYKESDDCINRMRRLYGANMRKYDNHRRDTPDAVQGGYFRALPGEACFGDGYPHRQGVHIVGIVVVLQWDYLENYSTQDSYAILSRFGSPGGRT